MKTRGLFLTISALTISALAAGCTPKNVLTGEDAVAPNTGMIEIEAQTGAMPIAEIKRGAVAYISSEFVRVRSTPDVGDNVVGQLNTNDKVEIIDPTPLTSNQFVAIRVLESNSEIARDTNFYVSLKYFNSKPVTLDPGATSLTPVQPAPAVTGGARSVSNRLFIVTNVATEKLRVYQRCVAGESCVNRMIFEADVVNGQDDDGTRTNVGYYKVTTWHKFYESPATVYPAWYKPGYPDVPQPGDRSGWFQSQYMPNGKGAMRGAFGWYTAHVGPNANGQWTHGTGGWGSDKRDFITFKDSFLGAIASIFTSIRSHGCTRIDNESIAYLRNLIAIGTPLVKVYAQEGYRDANRPGYSQTRPQWNYIITKLGAQKQDSAHQLADRGVVLAAGTPRSEWIEEGTYEIDQYPDAASGDLYRLGGGAFQGTFIVDEGTVYNYRHPQSGVQRGGLSDQIVPEYMVTRNAPTSAQPVPSRSSGPSGPSSDPWMTGGP